MEHPPSSDMTLLLCTLTTLIPWGSATEANSLVASQEIPRLLWNSNIHCRVRKRCPLDQTDPSTFPHLISLIPIFIKSSHLYRNLQKCSLSCKFPPEFHTYFSSFRACYISYPCHHHPTFRRSSLYPLSKDSDCRYL